MSSWRFFLLIIIIIDGFWVDYKQKSRVRIGCKPDACRALLVTCQVLHTQISKKNSFIKISTFIKYLNKFHHQFSVYNDAYISTKALTNLLSNPLFYLLSGYVMLRHKGQTVAIPCAVAEVTEHSLWKSWSGVNANITGAVTWSAKHVGHGLMLMNATEKCSK